MNKYFIISFILLFAVSLGVAGGLWVCSSLWFMWDLLPSDRQSALALKYSPLLDYYLKENNVFSLDVPHYLSARRLAYSKGHEGDVLVVLPTLKNQFSLKSTLEDEGWNVERIGLLLYAHNNIESNIDLVSSSRKILSRMVDRAYPVNPLFVVDFKEGSLPYVDRDIFGVGVSNRGYVGMKLAFNGEALSGVRLENEVREIENDSGSLELYIPANSISFINDDHIDQWNDLLLNRAGISHTKPQIVTNLMDQENVLITLGSNSFSVGIEGDKEEFIEYMIGIITKEEAHTRPITSPFRLPDGSLGYEKIPGEEKDIFEKENGCLKTMDVETSLWLCLKNNRVVVSTSSDQAKRALNKEVDGAWEMNIGGNYLKMLQLENIKHLQARGDDGYAIIHLLVE